MSVAAYTAIEDRLQSIDPKGDLSGAVWIDLYKPGKADADRIAELGVTIPRLKDMGQIEPSRRLTRREEVDGITVLMTEPSGDGDDSFAPVTFLFTQTKLVTVRYHAERLWDGFTLTRRTTPGDVLAALLLLGVGHIADVLEAWDRELDVSARDIFKEDALKAPDLRRKIRASGRMGEALSDIRLNLLIIRRAVVHLEQLRAEGRVSFSRKQAIKTLDRDVEALTVHADYLEGRLNLAVEATMGLISLAQNDNARIHSIVATIFLPATLIASIFGMNFEWMPFLDWQFGFDISLGLMVAAACALLGILIYRRWL